MTSLTGNIIILGIPLFVIITLIITWKCKRVWFKYVLIFYVFLIILSNLPVIKKDQCVNFNGARCLQSVSRVNFWSYIDPPLLY